MKIKFIFFFIFSLIIYSYIVLLEYMDDDIRGALFNDEDEEGKFEELDDDFVIQVHTINLVIY